MKRFIAILLTLVLAIGILPAAASAASVDPQGAARWDPLTPPSQVYGTLVGTNTFQASTTLNAGKNGYLRAMPTLDVPSGYYIYTYNASAYCGAKAVSSNPNVVDVKSIEIGKWQGGAWDGADCMQVTVDPKQAGTATVTINFYYTFSQSANPFTNRNAQWFYGTMYYTVKVTGSTQYTITYTDGVDDAEIFPDQVSKAVKGSATPAFNGVPERSGYLFTGWSPEVAPTVTADQTYTATWVKLENVVIYGVTDQDKATKEKLFTVKAPHGANLADFLNSLDIDLNRDDYDCEGWYNFDWFGHKLNAAITVNGWTNVYVNYTLKKYSVTFKDGEDRSETQTVTHGSTANLPDWTKDGYILDGWYETPDCSGDPFDPATPIEHDLVLYPKWVKLETVVIYGVTGQDKATKEKLFTVKAPHGVNLVDFLNSLDIDLSRDNYDCEGWYNFDWFGHKFNAAITVNGWMNAYVNYTPKAPTAYTVTFTDGIWRTETVTVNSGETVTLPDWLREGYILEGWYEAPDCSGEPFDPAAAVDRDYVLYPKWTAVYGENEYYLYYNSNSPDDDVTGLPVTDKESGKGDHDIRLSGSAPKRAGYRFLGWSLDPHATAATYQPGKLIRFTDEIRVQTLYAVWVKVEIGAEEGFLLHFDANGGNLNGIPASDWGKGQDEHKFTLPKKDSKKDPVREGCTFVGWSLDPNADPNGSDVYKPGSSFTLSAPDYSATLYAIWVKN